MVCPAGSTSVTAKQHLPCHASIVLAVTLTGVVCSDTGCSPGCLELLCMYAADWQRLKKEKEEKKKKKKRKNRKKKTGFDCRIKLWWALRC